jgi:hypothetical protein
VLNVVSTQAVVRDILAEIDEIDTSLVLRAAVREVVRQKGKAKLKEMGRRVAAAYIGNMHLPLDGALARRAALPALDRMIDDALDALEK